MKRPIMANSSLFLDATDKASRIRMEPVAPYSHNKMSMPYHLATSKIEGFSSLEAVLKVFWASQRDETANFTGFNRQNHLPVSRVKKILKSDPRVTMISKEAPALFSKACEYLILELTLRAWMHTQSCSRQTIQRCDIFQAIKNSETYGFLIHLVPFGMHCAIHQGVIEHEKPEKVLPPAEMFLPDMNIPIDMNEVEQENLIAEPSINHKGFDLNSISSEHDSAGSYLAKET
ncbi:nuclear transcription factor Y subunit C-10 isoform X2 [Eutrema salsugineum]|uniref:nuclear transcription factor Y subunit C-10 isoform X2 n=1 Tax=Eutrema salsugineum TaxID=72664 RepID=UPI000CED3C5D|nr:nuclear transcription factor Y subunit C-10 isoform X2 [Eutrema salsugineum]